MQTRVLKPFHSIFFPISSGLEQQHCMSQGQKENKFATRIYAKTIKDGDAANRGRTFRAVNLSKFGNWNFLLRTWKGRRKNKEKKILRSL